VQHENPWAPITSWSEISILRNDYEMISLRMVKHLTIGRLILDMTLRRGMRFIEVYVQRYAADRIGIVRTVTTASTATSGYVVATANDPAGNRGVVGSARTFTADTINGGITKSATTTLDAMIGVVMNGGSALAGDAAVDLYAQYLGAPGEIVRGVRR
jgi:hypothetical protein